MRYYFLLCFVLFCRPLVAQEVLSKDDFLFRVATQVVTLSELKDLQHKLLLYRCVNPTSLIGRYHKIYISNETSDIIQINASGHYSKQQIDLFHRFAHFYALAHFAKDNEAQGANREQLSKGLVLLAKQRQCPVNAQWSPERLFDHLEIVLLVNEYMKKNLTLSEIDSDKDFVESVEKLIQSLAQQINMKYFR